VSWLCSRAVTVTVTVTVSSVERLQFTVAVVTKKQKICNYNQPPHRTEEERAGEQMKRHNINITCLHLQCIVVSWNLPYLSSCSTIHTSHGTISERTVNPNTINSFDLHATSTINHTLSDVFFLEGMRCSISCYENRGATNSKNIKICCNPVKDQRFTFMK
jgi:hypothetical protein